MSPYGKAVIALVYITWSVVAAYAWTKVEVDFNMDSYLVNDDQLLVSTYSDAKKKHYEDEGQLLGFYTMNSEDDLFSDTIQLQ